MTTDWRAFRPGLYAPQNAACAALERVLWERTVQCSDRVLELKALGGCDWKLAARAVVAHVRALDACWQAGDAAGLQTLLTRPIPEAQSNGRSERLS
jgi:hypothetical protein